MPLKNKVILGAVAVGVIVMLFIFGHEPGDRATRDTCPSQKIDPAHRHEGTCYVGGTKTVVVNPNHTLKLETLDARLVGTRETAALSGPKGIKLAKGVFMTFELAITNRTDAPAKLGENQVVLLVQGVYGEDVGVENGYEPSSFAARERTISPGETIRGTVTFAVPAGTAQAMFKEGNLVVGNFGAGGGDFEPEAMFGESEMGVVRTYEKPRS